MLPYPDPSVFDAPGLSRFTYCVKTSGSTVTARRRVAQLLRDLCEHEACGPDGLSVRVLRECADELSIPTPMLCEPSVSSRTFPTMWKQANVVPVHKMGSKKLPDNYRPISFLPICSKIPEKVVCESLLLACLPVSSHHGFLPKRSSITNLSYFVEYSWRSIARGKQTDAIYQIFTRHSPALITFSCCISYDTPLESLALLTTGSKRI